MAKTSKYKAILSDSDIPLNENGRITVYISKAARIKAEALKDLTGGSRNDVIEPAIHFYFGYISTGMEQSFLCDTYGTELKAAIQKSEALIRKNLYRLAVETDILTRLIANDYALTKEQYDACRAAAVKSVNHLNGTIAPHQLNQGTEKEGD